MNKRKISIRSIIPSIYYKDIREKLKEKHTQAITMAILTFLALALFGIFAINPTLSTITQLHRQLADKIEVKQKLDEKIRNISILQNLFLDIQKDIPAVEEALPQKPNAPYLLGQLNSIAQENNISLSQIQISTVPLTVPPDDRVTTFSFTVKAEGTRENITNFIKELSDFNRIVVLSEISVSQDLQSNPLTKITLQGNSYFKK